MNVTYSLEIIRDLKLALLLCQIGFYFSVCIIDDSQEHVDEHEEYKEDIGDEENRPKNSVCIFNFFEVEVTKDDTEQGVAVGKERMDA